MYLRNKSNEDLAEVEQLDVLMDPHATSLMVHYFAGEEMGEPVSVDKVDMVFPSGEALPRCWLDPHYRMHFD
ncbi:MAG: acetyltransferase [Zetaproteobacteria bacterium CG2_30_46_52]|nr:MAG: acetyltransferase [Zetaproteobacteria bacterium CG2_30_46_52]